MTNTTATAALGRAIDTLENAQDELVEQIGPDVLNAVTADCLAIEKAAADMLRKLADSVPIITTRIAPKRPMYRSNTAKGD